MNRFWIVPYKRKETHRPIRQFDQGYELIEGNTGTGPLPWHKRPISRLIQETGIAIRVHEILRSDEGRHPHNHPWWYITIILRGVYIEYRYDLAGHTISKRVHKAGSILFRPAGSWHMLTLLNGPVTTLFITGKKSQSWGYNVDGKQVNHLDYDGRM